MRVAYLTAGAGGMYCGSCMRDNTLAAALRRKGRDVILIPVYSPIRTDEEDVSEDRVLYGGVNVFLQEKMAFFRKSHRLLDRLLDSPALLRLATRNAGGPPNETVASLMISLLSGEAGRMSHELDKLIDALAELRPDVVHLPDAFFVSFARPLKERLGAAVVCTLTGEDILIDKLDEPLPSRCRELIGRHSADVDAFLSVSRYYTDYATTHLGIAADRIHQVPLGIRIDRPPGDSENAGVKPADQLFTIGYLARICPDKGLHVLCEAFAELHRRGRRCHLKVAGYLGAADRPYAQEIRRRLTHRGLGAFVEFLGEVDRDGKFGMIRSLDVFSVPAVYQEAKGIYVLEALSQGIPVVQPNHGSFPELIGATGGGVLFEPQNVAALADAISGLMDRPDRRRRLGEAGRRAVASSFTDEVMADAAWKVFESCRRIDPTAPAAAAK